MRKVRMGMIGFIILLIGIMQPKCIAKAEFTLKSLPLLSADSTSSADTVITISETIHGKLRTYVSLPNAVHDNALVEKVVLPKGIKSFLSDDYYESDDALIQNYSSMTPNCPNLKWIEVDKNNKSFMSRDGILYSKDGTKLYYCPPGKSGEVTIPEGVTKIEFQAFQDCTKITRINLPSTLKMIYSAAFGGNTGLLDITISKKNKAFKVVDQALFTKDGKVLYAYAGGRSEAVYTLPENVRIISDTVFKNCTNLKEFYANEDLVSIKVEAFRNCTNLKTVQLKEGLHEICAGAFMNCSSLTKLDLPEGLTTLYEDAIFGCTSLLDISLPESFQEIDYLGAFDDVEGRVIRVYNPFYFMGLDSYDRAKNVTVYTYRGSYTAAQLKKNGLKTAYFEEEYCNLPKQTEAPASAVKGSGKADTSWYDSKEYDFEITNPDQLAGLSVLVRKGIDFAGKSVMLMNDLDLGCYSNWTPIGYNKDGAQYSFKGSFDGCGYTIYHMRFITYTNTDLGLFGINEGDISYLNIEDSQILGKDYVGLLVGMNRGSIADCNVSGYVWGHKCVGGLVGYNEGSIKSCSVAAEIYGIHSVGGVTGTNYSMISNSQAEGTIFGYNEVGGIVGNNNGSLDYAYVTASQSEMEVNGYEAVGGIVGSCEDTYILDCTNYGTVNGNEYVGGVAGNNILHGNVINCKNQGGITGNYCVGGISGIMSIGMIINCENEGEVAGFSEIGGVLGTLEIVTPDYDRVLISESSRTPAGRYSVGEVIGLKT